jgi:hypothetical protein
MHGRLGKRKKGKLTQSVVSQKVILVGVHCLVVWSCVAGVVLLPDGVGWVCERYEGVAGKGPSNQPRYVACCVLHCIASGNNMFGRETIDWVGWLLTW